jgi:hypothetical protein
MNGAALLGRLYTACFVVFVGDFVIAWLVHPVPEWVVPVMLASLGVAFLVTVLYFILYGFEDHTRKGIEPGKAGGYGAERVPAASERPTGFEKKFQFAFIWIVFTGIVMGLYETQFSDGKTDTSILNDPSFVLEVALCALVGWVATRAAFFAADKGWIN